MNKNEDNKGFLGGSLRSHRASKIIGIIIGIVFALFAGITVLGVYWPDIQDRRYQLESERFGKEVELARQKLIEAEKADTFGGKTPEETLDMFLSALKNNNAELVAKYYDLTVQKEALKNLKLESAEKGDLGVSFKYFSDVKKGSKECNENSDKCVFEYLYQTDRDETVGIEGRSETFFVPKGVDQRKILDLRLNQISNLWKAFQPL